MVQALDADAVRRWCAAGLDVLATAREEINALNVFPVPDGDTGTNLYLTMQTVADEVARADVELAATVQAMARGALLGARGNSGVILSQILRGLADVFTGCPVATGGDLQRALEHAARLAYDAVADPVEGTVLTVARAAARCANEADPADLAAVVNAAAKGAAEELARTPLHLAALAAAGVVDAGGRGLVVLLDALAEVVTGTTAVDTAAHVVPRTRAAVTAAREAGSEDYAYEVQYLIDVPDARVPALREALAPLGDSLVVVGGDGLFKVHVHVNDVGAALEAGIEAGRPHAIAVTRFVDQIAADEAGRKAAATSPAAADTVAVVAVAPGEGLCKLFVESGACVVDGGPTNNPSTRELLDAVLAAGAAHVTVLPNDSNVRAVATRAAELAREHGREVAVIPTRSPVQGLAALAVHDPTRRFGDDVIAMTSAAGATRFGEVTVAVRDAGTPAGEVHQGQTLGLLDGEVVTVGTDVPEVARGLLDRMLIGGGELVTIVVGADADASLAAGLCDYLDAVRPHIETVVYDGGQPHYPLLLGVE